jgi:hypothetical protein
MLKKVINQSIENYIVTYDKKYINNVLKYRDEIEPLTKTINLFLIDIPKVIIKKITMSINNFDFFNKCNKQVHYVNFIFVFTVYDGKRFSMTVGFSYKNYNNIDNYRKYSLLWNSSCHPLNMKKDSMDHWRNLQAYQFLNEMYG